MISNHVPNQIKQNIIQAQNGNIEARNEVLKFIYPLIKKACKDEDLQQSTILRIEKFLYSFNVEKGNFIHWSFVIMKNVRYRSFEKQQKLKENENCFSNYPLEFEPLFYGLNKTTQKEFEFNTLDVNKAIHEIVESLAPSQKKIFKMSAFEGLTHVEIGQYLNITASTSKSQLMRAKQTIIKQLKRKYNYEQN
jgi:RNA polymerase sigma factor (sigma-70 family)